DAKFTGATPLRAAGGLDAPGFLVVNAGARYLTRVGRHDVTLRASIDNVLNRRYWEYQYADYVKPGDRSASTRNSPVRRRCARPAASTHRAFSSSTRARVT
ncbi:TonB-dependent receptor, partial [Burkholderia cenocepacia]|nr:TonB-dependent receptor [Burkholderia cenocepacia]